MTRYRHTSVPGSNGKFVQTIDFGTPTVLYEQKPDLYNASINDVQVQNFHKLVAAGAVFNNPFSSYKTSYEANDNYIFSLWNPTSPSIRNTAEITDGFWLTRKFRGGLPFPTVVLDVDGAIAKAKLTAIASVNKTEFNALAFAGEWSKTKRLHREVGQSLLKVFAEGAKYSQRKRVLKRTPLFDELGRPMLTKSGKPVFRNLHSGGEELRVPASVRSTNMANAYLVGRFGVGPLLHDLDNAVKFLASGRRLRQTARGTEVLTGQQQIPFGIVEYAGTEHILTLTTSRIYTVRAGLLYETDPVSRALAQLGITRPLSAAWELTPWSFVIDRFVKVGQYLDAIQPAGFVKNLAAWVSSTETIVKTATVASSLGGVHSNGNHFTCSWNGALISQSTLKTRLVWNDLTVPKLPIVDGDVKSIHALDYAALVLQKIGIKRTFK